MKSLRAKLSSLAALIKGKIKKVLRWKAALILGGSACYKVCGVARDVLSMDDKCHQNLLTVPSGIATRSGDNLSHKAKLITTYFEPNDGKKPWESNLFLFSFSRMFPKIYKTDLPVVTVCTGWQGAFYHWVYQVLPRLAHIDLNHVEKIYVETFYPFQKESLALLGIDETKIINAKQFDAVITPKLIIPSIPKGPTPESCRFLQHHFGKKMQATRRIYISRADAKTRRIQNETDLWSLLQSHGFEKILMTDLSFEKQIETFASASAIVAPHGAGLSHLVFCNPNTPILEIFSPRYLNRCYEQLSQINSLPYQAIYGECIGSGNDPDILIDLQPVKQFLTTI